MKKHIIAAAVAGALAVPAMAQVTISGTLDVQAMNNGTISVGNGAAERDRKSTGSGAPSADAVDGFSTSQLVLTAEDDLGGGLKAKGVYVQRLLNELGARDRYIELSGGFGAVRVGRFNPTITSNYLGLSGLASTGNAGEFYNFVTGGSYFAETNNATTGTSKSFREGSYERQDNILQYVSPSFGGVSVSLGYTARKEDRDNQDVARLGEAEVTQLYTTLGYSAGPLSLGLGYAERDNNREAAPLVAATATALQVNAVTRRELSSELMWVAGGYDFGAAKLNVSYATRDVDQRVAAANTNVFGAAATKINDAKLTAVSLTVPLGAITLAGSVYEGDDAGAAGVATGVDTEGYQVSVRYALSKRTFAYLITGESEVKRDNRTLSGSTDMTFKQTGLGLVHNF